MNPCPLELLSVVSLRPTFSNKTDKDIQRGTETEQDQYRDININHYYTSVFKDKLKATHDLSDSLLKFFKAVLPFHSSVCCLFMNVESLASSEK